MEGASIKVWVTNQYYRKVAFNHERMRTGMVAMPARGVSLPIRAFRECLVPSLTCCFHGYPGMDLHAWVQPEVPLCR